MKYIETVTAFPPELFDGITDEEDFDDDLLTVDEPLERDTTGTFEFETRYDRKCISSDLSDDAPSIEVSVRKSARIASTANGDDSDNQPSTFKGTSRFGKRNLFFKKLGRKEGYYLSKILMIMKVMTH